ncbi:hypothetical protein [Mycoplasma sp. CSL7503-lung]|uniref:hypothetical protein n=1 Tax=Mycoplasma sp. CSL7503-lung TaxID=536372 RepID=UPI0021D05644|nr:hypothetical protein [Mycoplasma sp. CSL7503-lung]MCU4706352.1 hypothetical protein [Mycoplasma sp. CSL7503-lung]
MMDIIIYFDKKWDKEEYISEFYKNLDQIEKFKIILEHKKLSEEEYNENLKILDKYSAFYNGFPSKIHPIKVTQIIRFSSFEEDINNIKEILNGSIYELKISNLRDIRTKLEKELGLDGTFYEKLSERLDLYNESKELKYLKEITKNLLNPASHNNETKAFKEKIDKLTLTDINTIETNIINYAKKLKINNKKIKSEIKR